MTSPDHPPGPRTGPTRPSATAGILLTITLAVIGAFVSLLSLLLPMASYSCTGASSRPICSTTIQWVAALLPGTAYVVGLLVAFVGLLVATGQGRSPTRWPLWGWLIFIIGTAVAWILAGL